MLGDYSVKTRHFVESPRRTVECLCLVTQHRFIMDSQTIGTSTAEDIVMKAIEGGALPQIYLAKVEYLRCRCVAEGGASGCEKGALLLIIRDI
jgi:hypothetical protein